MKLPIDQTKLIDLLKNQTLLFTEELSQYREKVLSINEHNDPRDLFLYTDSKESVNKISSEFVSFFKAMEKLVRYIIYEEPKLLDYIGKSGVDIDALKKREADALLGYARIDTALTDSGLKIFEFNSRRPQMYEDADWFCKVIENNFPDSGLEIENNSLKIMQSILSQYQVNQKRNPENIIIVNNFPAQVYSFSATNVLKNIFKDSVINLLRCSDLEKFYDELNLEGKNLMYKSKKIDLIILQNICARKSLFTKKGGIRVSTIRKAYNSKTVEIFTSPAGQISGTKLSLDLLKQVDIVKKLGLSSDEKSSLQMVPESFHSENIRDLVFGDKDRYVLKMTGLGQGQGVRLGVEFSNELWVKELTKLLEKKVRFLIQERVKFKSDQIFSLKSNSEVEAYITVEPFLINNPLQKQRVSVSGFAMRAIPIENYREDLKFNPAYNEKGIYFGALIETS